MKQLCLFLLVVLGFNESLIAQTRPDQKSATGYCDSNWCKLAKDHPAHFDPYYNGHLCENFNPAQADFSQEYLKLQTSHSGKNVVTDLSNYDLSAIWPTIDGQQNGIIGLDYKRIRIHISKVTRDNQDKLVYHVKGKSNVSGNICDFTGSIRLISAYDLPADSEYQNAGNLFAEYTFYEDETQKHVGTFQGIKKAKKAFLDESSDLADGYYNRTYIGTWTSYTGETSKKCIWGDFQIRTNPF